MPPHVLGRRSLDDIRDATEGGYNVNQQHPENGWTILHSLFREREKDIDKIMFILSNCNPDISLSGGDCNRTIFYSFTLWSMVDTYDIEMVLTKLLRMDEVGFVVRHIDTKGLNVIEFFESVLAHNIMRDGENGYCAFLRQIMSIFKLHMQNTERFHKDEYDDSPLSSLNQSFIDDDIFAPEPSSSSSYYSFGKKRTQRV